MVASSGAQLLEDDAVDALVGRLFPLATVVTPNLMEAKALAGLDGVTRRELAERLHELGAPAVIVTGGHGEDAGRPSLRRRRRTSRSPSSGTTSLRRTAPAARTRRRSPHCSPAARLARRGARRGSGRSLARGRARSCGARLWRRSRRRAGGAQHDDLAGATLRAMRERKPLVHQITNYVVMNETANATLALGALPVMAHAGEEVEEMARLASALVLNIGTLSEPLDRGDAARGRRRERARDSRRARPRRRRRHRRTARRRRSRILDLVDVTVLRGNAGEVATLVGAQAEVRGVESIEQRSSRRSSRARPRGSSASIASVTGPVDHVSRRRARARGRRTATRCSRPSPGPAACRLR